MLLSFEANHLYIFLIVLAVILIWLWMKKRNFPYLFFCAIFGIYLIGVTSVIVFPIHIPDGNNAHALHLRFNLIPLYFGDCDFVFLCLRTIYENVLLTTPFGFGISFIVSFKPKNILWLAIAVGMFFEFLQLILALIFRSAFRAIDINDVILNAIGVLIGYGFFKTFGWLYLNVIGKLKIDQNPVFAFLSDVVRRPENY